MKTMLHLRKYFGIIVIIALTSLFSISCNDPINAVVDTVINIATIQGITVPTTGGTAVTAITENDQYSGTVKWSPAVSGSFAPLTQYTATISLTAKSGYTLEGVPANLFTVAGATSVSNAANSGVITAVFPKTNPLSDTVINIAAIPGVAIPTAGGSPVSAIIDTAQFGGTVTWSPAVSENFAASTVYTAYISLSPNEGYTLQGVPENFFSVAGATSVSNAAGSGAVTAVFPPTASPLDTVISIAAIQGLTVPATGETPVTAITENAQYSGTVSWSPNHSTFAASTVYTATISLTAKSGYTLDGVSANLFTIAGATSVSNVANSGIITAVFPATAATVVNIAAIQGLVPPVSGATPVTAITENAQYSGTVSWSPSHSTFAGSTIYTATVTLTAKSGYTLDGVAANFFTVVGATSVSNAANSGIITAVFPATAIALPWARTISGTGTSMFFAVAVDLNKNAYVAGSAHGSVIYGPGVTVEVPNNDSNVVLVKYDPNGTALWARTISSGTGNSWFEAVTVDSSGSVYAAGMQYGTSSYTYGPGVSAQGSSSKNNSVLVKYDPNGTALWAQTVSTGTGGSTFSAVAVDSSGSVYAAGNQFGTDSYTYGPGVSAQGTASLNNPVLAKYNSNGTALWAQTVSAGTGDTSHFNAVAVDYSGNVYAAGYQEGTGSYTYGPGVSAQGSSLNNAVLVKYGSNGAALWALTGTGGFSDFKGVALDSSGNVYATGGPGLVKYNSNGTALWELTSIAEAPYFEPYSVAVDSFGNVYVAGLNGRDAVLIKHDSNGTELWTPKVSTAQSFLSNDNARFFAVAVDSSGNAYAAGWQEDTYVYTYDPGVTAQGSSSAANAVLVKYVD